MRACQSRFRGLGAAPLFGVLLALVPGTARASGEDLKEACAASYEQAQTLRRAAKLTLARAQMAVCQETCPSSLAKDCRRWSDEIEAEMPSVVIAAVDRAGSPLSEVELSVDGELRDAPPVGSPLLLDPGRHRLVLRVGEERHTATVTLEPRERREVRIAFASVRAQPSASVPEPVVGDPALDRKRELEIPPAAWALGAIGLVGLGTGAVLGIKGHVDRSDLSSRCAPNCDQDDVDAIERDWTIAAIAAAVGAVASGVAVWLVVDAERETHVGLSMAPGAGVGMIGGRF